MDLQGVAQYGTVDDVKNLIDIFINLMTALSPILSTLIIIYVVRNIKNRIKLKNKQKHCKVKTEHVIEELTVENCKNNNNKKAIEHLFNDDNAMMEKLNNIGEPENKNNYDSLYLEFGEDGKVIKN